MQETKEIDPYSLFLFSLKSKESRLKYAQRINRFFDFIEIPSGDIALRCKVFVQNGCEDPNYVLNRIILFLQAQKEKVENKELASGCHCRITILEKIDNNIVWKRNRDGDRYA